MRDFLEQVQNGDYTREDYLRVLSMHPDLDFKVNPALLPVHPSSTFRLELTVDLTNKLNKVESDRVELKIELDEDRYNKLNELGSKIRATLSDLSAIKYEFEGKDARSIQVISIDVKADLITHHEDKPFDTLLDISDSSLIPMVENKTQLAAYVSALQSTGDFSFFKFIYDSEEVPSIKALAKLYIRGELEELLHDALVTVESEYANYSLPNKNIIALNNILDVNTINLTAKVILAII